MKKHLVLGALAVLSLAACTKSEVVELNKGNEISLTAVTGKNLTKAADGYCNKAMPGDIAVWAATGGKTYFEAQTYTRDGETSTYKSATARYWPNTAAVDFFAAKNYGGSATLTATDPTSLAIADYTVTTTVADQKDFIYAVTKGATKAGGAAELFFRHALSQIEFQAKNSNSGIYVEISGVTIKNVCSVGDFSVSVATTNNFVDHNLGESADTDIRTGRCTWENRETPKDYAISFSPAVKVQSTATSLSVADDSGKEYNARTMYLIPQTVPNLWGGTGKPNAGDAYFELTADIWNVAGSSFNSSTDVQLHTGTIAVPIPASTTWQDGLRYVYTFNFTTTGTGGVDPGTGEPVLTPITLTVTVDDFVDAGETEVKVQ